MAAKRSRKSGVRPAVGRPSSVTRKPVKAYPCVDCGEKFFEVDREAGRVFVVDGQPVCALCLKKRRRLVSWPLAAGAGVVLLALLLLFPLQTLAGLVLMSLGVIAVALYYTKWTARTRAVTAAVAFSAAGVSLIAHGMVGQARHRAALDRAMAPHYAACRKAHEAEDLMALRDAVMRAEQALEELPASERHEGIVGAWRKKRDKLLGPVDPFDAGLYWYVSTKIPISERWGKPPVRRVKSKKGASGKRTVDIHLYAPENFELPRGRDVAKSEIRNIFASVLLWSRTIDKIAVVVQVPKEDEDAEIGRFGLDRGSYLRWREETRENDIGERLGAEIFEFCDPNKWWP